jgi:YD repeat-containing protein
MFDKNCYGATPGGVFDQATKECLCPTNTKWVSSAASCKRIVNNYFFPDQTCPAGGNPIYPLTGAKTQTEELGAWLGLRFGIRYDTRSKLPANDPDSSFLPKPPSSFGELWQSTVHKKLVTQVGLSNVVKIVAHAARGSGDWKSFLLPDGTGNGVPSSYISDRLLISVATGYDAGTYRDHDARSIETYDGQGNLTSVAYLDGRTLAYVYSDANTPVSVAPAPGLLIEIRDQTTRSVRFAYELPAGVTTARIYQITDPTNNKFSIGYDANGNVASLVRPGQSPVTFLYENVALPWALTGIVPEDGQRLSRYAYDTQGRAVSTELAGSVGRYALSYGSPPSWSITETFDSYHDVIWREHRWALPTGASMTMPSGTRADYGFGMAAGVPRLNSQSQAAGSGCAASTNAQTNDANGNKLSADDFNGHRACYVSDLSRNLELVRVEGLANTAACGTYTATNAILPSGSRKVSTLWHPEWRLQTRIAEPGKLTTSVYNGQPDPFNAGATASCAPSTALLPDGKPIAVLCKQVDQATTDVAGAKGFDLSGTPASIPDPSFNNVSLLLHMDGASGSTAFTDSSVNAFAITAIGNAQVSTTQSVFAGASALFDGAGDRLSVPSSPQFDFGTGDFTVEAFVRLNALAAAGGIVSKRATSNDYQPFGIIQYGSQVLFVLSTTGAGWDYLYFSPSGVLTTNTWYHVALTRQNGTVRAFVNGALLSTATLTGALVTNTQPLNIGAGTADSSQDLNGWVDEFRISKGLARYTSAFTPPTGPFGGPTSVPAVPSALDTTVANRIRSWTYNAYGQVLTDKGPRTDVNDTTTYTYYTDTVFTGVDPNAVGHTVGDLQSMTNAVGKVTSYTQYNKHGQVLQQSDPNGVVTVNTYDLRQRLLSTSVGGQTTSYSYDAAGQLLKVTAPDASWIGYEYDPAHRQTVVKDNLGNRIEYVLDNAGNKIAQNVKDPGGALKRTLTRSIDALGRVQQTTGRE